MPGNPNNLALLAIQQMDTAVVAADASGKVVETLGRLPSGICVGESLFDVLPVLVGMEGVFEQLAQDANRDPSGDTPPLHIRHASIMPSIDGLASEQQASPETVGLRISGGAPGQVLVIFSRDKDMVQHESAQVQATNAAALIAETNAATVDARLFSPAEHELVQALAGPHVRMGLVSALRALDAGDTLGGLRRVHHTVAHIDALAYIAGLENAPERYTVGPITVSDLIEDCDSVDAPPTGQHYFPSPINRDALGICFALCRQMSGQRGLYFFRSSDDCMIVEVRGCAVSVEAFNQSTPGQLLARVAQHANTSISVDRRNDAIVLCFQ